MVLKNIKLFESFHSKKHTLTSRQGRNITVLVSGSRIEEIENKSGINFPFRKGQIYNRSIETWACTNGFKIDGKDPCPEEKIFGIKKKDIPRGHELRLLFPHKFR